MKQSVGFLSALSAALWFTLPAPAQPAAPSTPPSAGAAPQAAIPLDQAAADGFAGYYLIGPQRAVRYWREGEHFYFGAVGTPQRAEATPVASNAFSYANGGVTFTFHAGADGTITSVTINQGGREVSAPRIDESVAMSFSPPSAPASAKSPVPRSWTVMTGLTPQEITPRTTGTMDYWPCFSPDGKTVLFSRTLDGGKTWALSRVPAAGGAAQPFAKLPVSASRADWSRKSNRIAFIGGTPDGKSSIWVIDGTGRNAHAVPTVGVLVPSYPSWYPDGQTIGFGDAARNILYRISANGRTPIAITHQEQVLAGMSSISPDGTVVAFAGQKNSGQLYNQGDNQLWLVDGTGAAKPLEAQPLHGRTPSWSPDGKRLAFESDRGSPNGFLAVFVVNRDGTDLIQVTDYALNASHPVFSPDGHRLALAIGDPSRMEATIAMVTLPGDDHP